MKPGHPVTAALEGLDPPSNPLPWDEHPPKGHGAEEATAQPLLRNNRLSQKCSDTHLCPLMVAFSLMLSVDSLKLIATVNAENTSKVLGGQSRMPLSPHHFPTLCRKSVFLQGRTRQRRSRDVC